MCVSHISNNFFPFDYKPLSCIATASMVVAVAGAVLAAVAGALHWGVPAISACAATSGVAVMITLAIIWFNCRRSETRAEYRKRVPIPSEQFPEIYKNITVQGKADDAQHPKIQMELYALVKNRDVESFKKVIEPYEARDFASMSVNSHGIWLDSDDPLKDTLELSKKDPNDVYADNSVSSRSANSLFKIILAIEQPKKDQFLEAFLNKIPDGYLDRAEDHFLEVRNKKLIDLIIKKMSDHTTGKLFDLLIKQPIDSTHPWFTKLIKRRAQINSAYTHSDGFTLSEVATSAWDIDTKIEAMEAYAAQRRTTLEAMRFESIYLSHQQTVTNGHILHIAVASKNSDLVQKLSVEYPKLVNTAADGGYTPLIVAVMVGDLKVVQTLLGNKATAKHTLLKADFHWNLGLGRYNRELTQMTPLMLAAHLGHKAIVDALISHSDVTVTDNPSSDKAWTYLDYLKGK